MRHHLATAGALSAAGCPDASSDFGGIAGASSSASLGAGLCIASRLGDGALALSPSMLLDDDTDADTDAEDDVGGRFSTPQVTGRAGRGRTPRSAFARFGGPGGAPSATFADRGAASAPGSRLRGHQCSRRSPRVVRASRVWSRLVLGHEGAAISSDADEGEGASSAEGSVDEDSAYHLESAALAASRVPSVRRVRRQHQPSVFGTRSDLEVEVAPAEAVAAKEQAGESRGASSHRVQATVAKEVTRQLRLPLRQFRRRPGVSCALSGALDEPDRRARMGEGRGASHCGAQRGDGITYLYEVTRSTHSIRD